MSELSIVTYPDLETARMVAFPFPIPAVMTLKAAGDMGPSGGEIGDDRGRVLDDLHIDADCFVSLHQVHSRAVHVAHRDTYGVDGDGLIARDIDLTLGVTVADCMPIFLYDDRSGAFGLLHSGWRGTGIAADALDLMGKRFGTEPARVTALIGPCIGPCCYRVDEERASLFATWWGTETVHHRDGGRFLDLPRANVDLLAMRGVGTILDAHVCTACHPIFASFRREGPEKHTGMLALIGDMTIPDGIPHGAAPSTVL